ncbi:MAG: hypothetical protein ABIH71_02015 [Candidatus Omnitrophota bacterium]
MIDVYQLIGKFAFHLSDTHGLPLQIFKQIYFENGYLKKEIFLLSLREHKDFLKKLKEDNFN